MTRPTMEELRAQLGVGQWWYKRYGAEPGTGPEGKTCGDCEFITSTDPQGRGGRHMKCGKTAYTSGDATSIKVRTPACRLFQPIRETMEHG